MDKEKLVQQLLAVVTQAEGNVQAADQLVRELEEEQRQLLERLRAARHQTHLAFLDRSEVYQTLHEAGFEETELWALRRQLQQEVAGG